MPLVLLQQIDLKVYLIPFFFLSESNSNSFPGSHKGRKGGIGEERVFQVFVFFKTNFPFDHNILKC